MTLRVRGLLVFVLFVPSTLAGVADPAPCDLSDASRARPSPEGTRAGVQDGELPDASGQPGPSRNWRIETIDDRARAGVYASLAFDGSGHPVVAYSSDSGARLASWNGSAWDLETVDATGKGKGISLAFEPASGRPCVTYSHRGSLDYVCKRESSWLRRSIESRGVTGLNTSLAFDAAGRAAVAFTVTGRSGGLRLARDEGTSWRIETVDARARASYLSLAFDPDGNPAIAYDDDRNEENAHVAGVKCARWDGSSWTIEAVEGDFEPQKGYSAALVFDPATGQPVIFHTCNVYWIGRLMTKTGGDWIVEDAGKVNDGRFTFDSIGTPMLAVTTEGDLYFYTKSASGWEEELVDSRSGEYFKWQPSIALGPDGRPAIAYHEHHEGVLKFAWREP